MIDRGELKILYPFGTWGFDPAPGIFFRWVTGLVGCPSQGRTEWGGCP